MGAAGLPLPHRFAATRAYLTIIAVIATWRRVGLAAGVAHVVYGPAVVADPVLLPGQHHVTAHHMAVRTQGGE